MFDCVQRYAPAAIAATIAMVALQSGPAHARADCDSQVSVERGETLNMIARRCGVPLTLLLRENSHISNPDLVTVGTVLEMPDPQIAREAMQRQVEVQPGDTLATIAERHGIPLAVVISANPDVHPEEVASGTIVGLPDS